MYSHYPMGMVQTTDVEIVKCYYHMEKMKYYEYKCHKHMHHKKHYKKYYKRYCYHRKMYEHYYKKGYYAMPYPTASAQQPMSPSCYPTAHYDKRDDSSSSY
ncbi:hypothetical protein P4S93_01395 [Aneurinibacillus thermoaerophilus]|uniref:Uncharacterized protein n=1 Tax=Aneurinibacillus thermoaerophilus TaxID=143495 RepID=A0A1G7ZLE6_ANETH|nr:MULTISPECIES: hypothetical protein [Aneurinibacillus]MED0758780.1 hypothetical protein [Aneurinibacillus thermoaerophilus]MED0759444.1 hypothetical protein [Aneurinibacillus thermoaerophilus]QYY41810.1 hypothetical protein K3F53_12930 [Aneurinibacillus thermoaerophilus]SDH09479.1 hypothetical protein SAMN04489735_101140 [Aneurinibacillus thermoaerophilus]